MKTGSEEGCGPGCSPRKLGSAKMRPAKVATALSIAILSLVIPALTAPVAESGAVFTDTQAVGSNKLTADTLKPPTGVTVTSVAGGVAKLSWKQSTSAYAKGYQVLRSANSYGPWVTIGTTSGRASTAYTDNASGATQWFYRVEATSGKWVSTGQAHEAPPPVGREFYDSFGYTTEKEPLNGRKTEDGSSTWLVWHGADGAYVLGGGAAGAPDQETVAVVRTPVSQGILYAEDFDGYEAFILRGKDPQNYLYAGGTNVAGEFQIVEVRNGKKTVLKMLTHIGMNLNMRAEMRGNTISVYKDAIRGKAGSGTLVTSATTTFLANDATATYFGIGWTRTGFGIDDFTFSAL